MKKLLACALFLVSASVAAQTHVTHPFHTFLDEPTVNVNGTVGQQQVDHFELKYDNGVFQNIGKPTGVLSTVPGFTTFSMLGDPTLAIGNHTVTGRACATVSGVVGCLDTAPLAFVLDPKAPPAPNMSVGP